MKRPPKHMWSVFRKEKDIIAKKRRRNIRQNNERSWWGAVKKISLSVLVYVNGCDEVILNWSILRVFKFPRRHVHIISSGKSVERRPWVSVAHNGLQVNRVSLAIPRNSEMLSHFNFLIGGNSPSHSYPNSGDPCHLAVTGGSSLRSFGLCVVPGSLLIRVAKREQRFHSIYSVI
ncbi:uncharacterized protein EI90DRAFT_3066903 [Cantharellus anzutake]|uniref:uncharacterized protein n=1 Tax=Cantharellus anzutake TaxID=1750568 RepID=UPI001906CAD1|nr:uncharacterized protein EI90DRAFT_3066903 [Cantharellus anzutake]KAF8327752.1 hypothetical protein EI90DRAFT_3066903 [Cantharellus anzutake]